MCFYELEQALIVTQSAVSYDLRTLRQLDFVKENVVKRIENYTRII